MFVIMVISLFGAALTACGESGGNYSFRIIKSSGEAAVTGTFTGQDMNNDGWVEKAEMTGFEEAAPIKFPFTFSNRSGWRAGFTEETLPTIKHTLADLESFKFGLDSWKGGKIFLEYRTKTKDSVVTKGYHFWRTCEVSSEAQTAKLFSGVGDGTKGLELTMTPLEGVQVEIIKN